METNTDKIVILEDKIKHFTHNTLENFAEVEIQPTVLPKKKKKFIFQRII